MIVLCTSAQYAKAARMAAAQGDRGLELILLRGLRRKLLAEGRRFGLEMRAPDAAQLRILRRAEEVAA